MPGPRKLSPETLHRRARSHNWDDGTAALRKILENPGCDRGTALLVYWRAMPQHYRQYARPEDAPAHERDVARLVADLERRLLANDFASNELWFDPTNDDRTDRTRPSDDPVRLASRPIPEALLRANLATPPAPRVDLPGELRTAVANGELERMRALLAQGASPHEKYGEAGSALHIAARVDRVEVVEALIAAGAKVDQRLHERTPLEWAVVSGHVAVAEALIRAGARPASAKLHEVVFAGAAMIRFLHERGAKLDALDGDGETPLYAAARGKCLEATRELLRLGADPSIGRKKDGKTPADKARELLDRARVVDLAGEGPDEARLGEARTLEAILLELSGTIPTTPATAPAPAREAATRARARSGDESAVIELASRLANGHKTVRINAAFELARSDDPIAVDALIGALLDENRIVRVHAWDGFVRHFRLGRCVEPRHGPLGRRFALLCSDVPAARARGAGEIAELAGRLREGRTLASLGLDVAVPEDDVHTDEFIASVRNPVGPIDVDAIRAMDPHHRAWAVIMLVSETVRDPVRPRAALSALGETAALDLLGE